MKLESLKRKEKKNRDQRDQIEKEKDFVVSIQRDHSKTGIQSQCCKPGPCSPKW